MSVRQRNRFIVSAVAVVAVTLCVSMVYGLLGDSGAPGSRTMVLTAKDMKFNTSNPTISVASGETIRLVFRNEDPGMKHELVIAGLGLRTPIIEAGKEAVLEFKAPDGGSFEYVCSLHPVSMKGVLVIEGPSADEAAAVQANQSGQK